MKRVGLVAMVICAGCATDRHRVPVPPAAPVAGSLVMGDKDEFLDLLDGYRLRVVTPLTKSGAFVVKTTLVGVRGDGNQLEVALRIDGDPGEFIGYETSYYVVTGQRRGVRIGFGSAERMIDGKAAPAATATVRLFEMPRGMRQARLVFLIRQSASDHDMAFVAANSAGTLESLTERVRANPDACRAARGVYCSWIPEGIAVRAEVRDAAGEWQPVK